MEWTRRSLMTTYEFKNESEFKMWVMNSLAHDFGFDFELHEDKRKAGIADVSYGAYGINGWIEFKFGNRAAFETAQPKWLTKRANAGGHVYVFIGFPDRSMTIYDCRRKEMYLLPIVDQYLGAMARILTLPYPKLRPRPLLGYHVPHPVPLQDSPGWRDFLSVLDKTFPS